MKQLSFSHSTWAAVILASTAGVFSACGGSSTPADAPQGGEASAEGSGLGDAAPEEAAEGGTKTFDEMTRPEKMKYMKQEVKPHMAKVFQELDADSYASFNCTTCHGKGAKHGEFDMPSDALPKLDQEEMEEHPEITQFMKERVVPEMAKLLGEEPYNMETGEGFGCYDCHMKKD